MLKIIKQEKNIVFVQYLGTIISQNYEVFIENYLEDPECLKSVGIYSSRQLIPIDLDLFSSYLSRTTILLVFRFRNNSEVIAEESFAFHLPTPVNLRKDTPYFTCCSDNSKYLIWQTDNSNDAFKYETYVRWKREGQIESDFVKVSNYAKVHMDVLPKEKNLFVWIEYKFTNALTLYSNKFLFTS